MVGQSNFHVVFTKILCGYNFYVWYSMKLKFVGQFQVASLSLCIWFETNKIWNRKAIDVFYNSSAQRLK